MNDNNELRAMFGRAIWISALNTGVELSEEERRQKWLDERADFLRLSSRVLNYLQRKGYVLTEVNNSLQDD